MNKLTRTITLMSFILILTSLSVSAVLVGDFKDATIPYDFTELNDTPADYMGSGLYSVIVNIGETALEFFDIRTWITDYAYNRTEMDTKLNDGTILHNNTGNLQGGTSNEYYHFTNSEHTSVLSGITNWITNTVNDLTNYYTKTKLTDSTTDLELASLSSKDLEVSDGTYNLIFNPSDSALKITGKSADLSHFPTLQFKYAGDNDPAMSYVLYNHDNIAQVFDAYHDGTNWISSDSGSNFAIYKTGDALKIGYKSGITKGTSLGSFNFDGAIFSKDGKLGLGVSPTEKLEVMGNINIPTGNTYNINGVAHNHNNIYYTETELDAGQLNNLYYTETETDILLSTKLEIENVARTIYVDADVSGGDNDGTSWANAFDNIQDAVDDIGGVVDGVAITITVKGSWSDFEEEEGIFGLSKICINNGYIKVQADDWINGNNVVSATASTVTFAGNYDEDYWKDCYTWIYSGTGKGNIRKVTASINSGANHVLTLANNWDTTPTAGAKLVVSGRARWSMTPFGFGFGDVYGKLTDVKMYGLAFHDFEEPEWVILNVGGGASISLNRCAFVDNGAAETDVNIGTGSSGSAGICAFKNSYNWGLQGYGAVDIAGYMAVFEGGGNGIKLGYGSKGDLAYQNFKDITEMDIYASQNSIALIYAPTGSDAGDYGIRADLGSMVRISQATSLSKSADAASFAYIES